MGKRKALAWFSGTALAFLLSACLDTAPTGPRAELSGYVVAYNAGPGVGGATIEVYEHGTATLVATASTASDGSYSLILPWGSYDLVVQTPGYAGSRVENVRVASSTKLNIVQRKAFNPSWPTDPPEVVVRGPTDGAQYDGRLGYVPYEIEVTPAPGLATDLIYAALGKTPGAGFLTGFRHIFLQTDATGPQFLDPLDFGAYGPTTFQAVVYDSNGNRTQVFRYIEVSAYLPGGTISDLQPPQITRHLAVTLGKAIEFFSVTPQAAPEGSNLWVELAWQPQTDFSSFPNDAPTGYHVERSFDGSNWERIASVPDTVTSYRDYSPELAPGKTVYYRVIAFAGNQESEPSNVVETTPLEPFAVNLLSPSDGATGVSTTPTFAWAPTQTVSDYHYYAGILWDTESGESAYFMNPFQVALVNRTNWTWNEDGAFSDTPLEQLQRGRTYEWNLAIAYALDDPNEPHAVSVAADILGLWFPFGLESKDHFSFTTAP